MSGTGTARPARFAGLSAGPRIRYGLWSSAPGEFRAAAQRLAAEDSVRAVCEVGGGANPILPLDFIRDHELDYVLFDISASQLAKAPAGYRKFQGDILAPPAALEGEYDLIISRFVAEHIRDPVVFHQNVFRLLAAGGQALHFFPTLYTTPFVVNRALPEWLSTRLLLRRSPHRRKEGRHAKFRAWYRWCRGPTARQIRRFEKVGFAVVDYAAFFGHAYYERVPVLRSIAPAIARRLARDPIPLLTSYAYVRLQKPGHHGAQST